jgi:hypothetical protein
MLNGQIEEEDAIGMVRRYQCGIDQRSTAAKWLNPLNSPLVARETLAGDAARGRIRCPDSIQRAIA